MTIFWIWRDILNKLQAEMDKERVWKERLMGKEYDDSVIG